MVFWKWWFNIYKKEKEAAKNIIIGTFTGVLGDVEKVANMSSGEHTINTYNENQITPKLEEWIQEIKKLNLKDENEIIHQIEVSKEDPNKLKQVLGNMLSRGAKLITVYPIIGQLMTLI